MEISRTPEGVRARCDQPLRGTDVRTQPYPGFCQVIELSEP